MASTTYEIAFKLVGSLSSGFEKSFSSANKAVENYNKSLNAMNLQASKLDGVVKMRKQTEESRKTYLLAEQRLKSMAQAMANTEKPSAGLVAAFKEQQKATDKARIAYDKNRKSLSNLEDKMGTAGTETSKLIRRQEEMARAADRARVAQEKYAKTVAGIKGSAAGMKENAPYAAMSGAAAGAGLGASVAQAMSFEDQRADLRKYSDEYQDIFGDIMNLTMQYGKTSEDMTKMATAAMQAGVAKTREDVVTIIEAQTQAAVAFEMTGDEVGAAWADIQSKMGLDVGKTKDVFDIINKLGNETSASSADIIEVLQRQGGTLTGLTALSAEQIAGLAGAFRSAAPSAEVAATAMGTFVGRLSNGSSATKKQQEALEKLGFDSVDLAKALTGTSDTAQDAIQNIFKQINKLPEHEKGAVIGELFGTEAGIKSAVATLASQSKLLSGNLATVGDKSNYAGSMFAEYSSRADTTSEALKIAQNILARLSGEIGDVFLPYVRKVLEDLPKLAGDVLAWVENNKELILVIGSVAAGIAAMTAAAVPLFIAWKTLLFYWNAAKLALGLVSLLFKKNTYAVIANKVALVANKVAAVAMRVAMLAWKGVVAICTAAQWAFNAAMSANPIALVIIAIAALIAIGILLYKNWDVIKARLVALWSTFSEKFPAIAAVMTSIYENSIKPVIDGIKRLFGGLVDFVAGVFTGNWSRAWEGVKNIFGGVFDSLIGLAKAPINAIISMINGVINGINEFKSFEVLGKKIDIGGNIPTIPQLATGGIATSPTLAMIGEGREDEAVLPLSKLGSMISGGARGGGSITVNFSPTINVSGNGADVEKGITAGVTNLKKELEKLLQNQRRVSYA